MKGFATSEEFSGHRAPCWTLITLPSVKLRYNGSPCAELGSEQLIPVHTRLIVNRATLRGGTLLTVHQKAVIIWNPDVYSFFLQWHGVSNTSEMSFPGQNHRDPGSY
jgi:hypothetical protein